MKNKYQRAQEYIHVTSEMKERILESVNKLKENKPSEARSFSCRRIRRIAAAAACLIIITGAALLIPHLLKHGQPPAFDMSRIQEKIDYDLYVPEKLPEGYQISHYTVLENAVNISYQFNESQINYTMSKNTFGINSLPPTDINNSENNHNSCYDVKYITVCNHLVTLYGSNSGYEYAEWYHNDYHFELAFSDSLSEDEIASIIENVNQYKQEPAV